MDRDACPDRRKDRLLHHIGSLGAGLESSIDHGATLRRRDTGRDREDDFRTKESHPTRYLTEEVLEHSLSDTVVGNRAIAEGLTRHDRIGCPPEHLFGLISDREHLVFRERDSDDRRLIDHHTLARHKHKRIGRTEVNPNFSQKQ